MLLRLLGEHAPSHVVVALDAPGKTFRDDLFDDYKATRAPTPDDLTAQVPRVIQVLEAFGIPVIGVPGLEADDVIACVVSRILADPAASDLQIRIVSRDKDLEQLLCDRVSIFDVHTGQSLDVAGLKEAKGITPAQVTDYLALIGDAVDNVPGVAGIGPKTAVSLLNKFGSLDGILANRDQLSPRQREQFDAADGTLPRSRQLVTLVCDADIPFSLDDARMQPILLDRILPLFRELGFGRHQDTVRKLVERQQEETRKAPPPPLPTPQAAFDFGV
jgi:DNA polymerase-1